MLTKNDLNQIKEIVTCAIAQSEERLKSDLKSELLSKAEFMHHMIELRSEMVSKTEFREEMASLRAEMNNNFGKVWKEFDRTWQELDEVKREVRMVGTIQKINKDAFEERFVRLENNFESIY